MRIVHIVPGSGGNFYCQNCLRDAGLVSALRAQGHDAVIAPMYLPMAADDTSAAADAPVFYGAVNVYLKQKLGLFRHAPRWLERALDAPALLRWAAAQAGATSAAGLEPMTLSVLDGEDGRQADELRQLVDWLADEARPEVVHLSNTLLLGLAPCIKRRLGVPVVCSLQDEDTWVDDMDPEWAGRIWQRMSALGRWVDAFVAVSDWFGGRMQGRLQLPAEKVWTIHVGIDPDAYDAVPPADPPVIGYLSRLAPALGFDVLVDAFIRLKQQPAFRAVRLRATGGVLGPDRDYVDGLRARLRAAGVLDDVSILDDFAAVDRARFLRGLTALSVPVTAGEAFGLFQLEAMAAGVPVVQPACGAFPEIVAATGGGIIYEPATVEALADALAGLDRKSTRLNSSHYS